MNVADLLACAAVGLARRRVAAFDQPAVRQKLDDTLVRMPGNCLDLALSHAGQAVALQTRHWKLIRSADERFLYAKSDDRWVVNDVASRRPQVVQALEEALAKLLEPGMSSGAAD